MTDAHARRAVEAVWRGESGRIVAALTRHTGDFAWAEDLAQDALLEAVAAWPESGIPDNPGAWLLTVAKRRAIDGWRRRERLAARETLMAGDLRAFEEWDAVPELGDPDRIDDDVLRLVFVACHPVLAAQARLALTLRTVAGLTTEQIARMLLMTVPAVQQRIVRAKRTLAEAGVPFEVPDRAERPARLASVLQVIYLLFTEGYAAGDGRHPIRPDVAREAVRLARQLSALMPGEPEVLALIALMEFQSSRFAERVDAAGLPVTLADQDRRRWDRSAIARGRAALAESQSVRPRARLLRPAGIRRGVPRGRAERRRHRLAAHRAAVRRARRAVAVAGRPAQPVGGRVDGRRPRSGARPRSTHSPSSSRSSVRCTPCGRSCSRSSARRMPRPQPSSSRPHCPATRPRPRCCAGARLPCRRTPLRASCSPTRRSRRGCG